MRIAEYTANPKATVNNTAAAATAAITAIRRPRLHTRGSVRGALNLTVPPSKERLTRNKLVNRWIFFWLTWGLIIGLPVIFFIFRADLLQRAGLNLVFDTANVCAPTVGGFNPYEGSNVCDNKGYTYTSSTDVNTSSATGVGNETGVDTLDVIPPRTVEEVNVAQVRLDVTTTLVVYFLILIGGIVVNMARWWRRDKRRKADLAHMTPPRASPGTA